MGRTHRRSSLGSLNVALAVLGTLTALPQLVGCSGPFESCSSLLTCPSDKDGGVAGSRGDAATGSGGRGTRDSGPASSSGGGGKGKGGSGATDAGSNTPTGTGSTTSAGGASGASDATPAPDATTGGPVDAGNPDARPLSCPPGHLDCNGWHSDGCEVELATDPDHCGTCDVKCSLSGATARACQDGACSVTCDATHRNCNVAGVVNDGCEVDVTSDPDNCGACGHVCSGAGTASRTCVDGVCQQTCDATHLDCNAGQENDGCEVDIAHDPDNCGACHFACSGQNVKQRACSAGTCAPACNTAFGDCSRPARPSLDDGCETALSQPTDCGACGHNCLGGACSSLVCQPLVLASGLTDAGAIAVDAQWVHWIEGTDAGRIVRSPLLGGGTTVVQTGQSYPKDITADGQYVYWTCSGTPPAVRRVSSGSSTVTELVTQFDANVQPRALAVDATNLYWSDFAYNRVYKLPKDGSATPVILVPTGGNGFAHDLAVDSTNVYFDRGATLQSEPIAGGFTPSSLSTNIGISFVVDSTYVYGETFVFGGNQYISRIKKTLTAAPEPLTVINAGNDTRYVQVGIDANAVYFTVPAGVYRLSKSGGTPQLLSSQTDHAVSLAVTSNAIYWVNQGATAGTGAVLKLAL